MRKTILLAAAAVSLGALSLANGASAQTVWVTHVLGTEDIANGWTGTVPSSAGGGDTITVASDGESTFQPFGITHDTSDAVMITNGGGWTPTNYNKWENVGGGVYDIPSCNASGCENANIFEPVGTWIWKGATWNNGNNIYIILDSKAEGGGLSDTIRTYNLADGTAAFSFQSGVPEPATWAMMILGVAMIGFAARRRSAGVTLAA